MTVTANSYTFTSSLAPEAEKKIWNEVRFLREQIELAKEKGRDGFDADRFMRKVGLKSW